MNPKTRVKNNSNTMSGPTPQSKKSDRLVDEFRHKILNWYDSHHRTLPWRAPPGYQAHPYHVWLSEVMLQQTVVAAVIPYFLKFVKTWPTVHDLAAAPQADVMAAWAGLGYYARARNLHKCAQHVSTLHDGRFPEDQTALKTLPGIGDYTSAAITSIAFDKPAVVMDGNIERVMARYFNVQTPLPDAKKELKDCAAAMSEGRTDRPGDYAQALMDLGATICIPKAPRCPLCPVREGCAAHHAGDAAALPRRQSKKAKPQKFGYIYWIVNEEGGILCERRPETVMLGGMIGLPTSEWALKDGDKPAAHPAIAAAHDMPPVPEDLRIFHSFTHFDLELEGRIAHVDRKAIALTDQSFWIDAAAMAQTGFPTVFKKFVRVMLQYKA